MTDNGQIDIRSLFASKNPRLAAKLPRWVFGILEKIAHQKEMNEILSGMEGIEGAAFAEAALRVLDIKLETRGAERIPPGGKLTFCANHPFGGADGLALMILAGKARGEFLSSSNDLLLSLPAFASSIIPVNKHGHSASLVENIEKMYSSDKALIVFPAGRTARYKGRVLTDYEWAKTFVKKGRKYERTIIPVYISGRNSFLFYAIWRIRTFFHITVNLEMFLLVDELFKKRGTTIPVTIGKPIPATVFDSTRTDAEWAELLRTHVDLLGTDPDRQFNEPKEKL